MKRIQIIIDCVLAAAVVALFILHFVAPKQVKTEEVQISGEHLPIAFVNSDSILLHYTFAIEANERLMSKQEDATVRLDGQYKAFQRDYESFQRDAADFQRKLESNAFLSRERAESEQQRLIKKQQDLENREAQLTQEIMIENQQLQAQLADTILSFLKQLNAEGRYQMIFSNNAKDNILLSAEEYDITAEVVSALNARYTPARKK